jgi:hypothetical protein
MGFTDNKVLVPIRFPRINVFWFYITVPTDLDETKSLTKESSVDVLVGKQTLHELKIRIVATRRNFQVS